MKLRNLSLAISLLVLAVLTQCSQPKQNEAEKKRPNILFLLADDLGYNELGVYGQKVLKTPVLDSLASVGMRFTNFYAGSPVCSPSRAVILTGKHSAVNTIRGNEGYFESGHRRVALRKDEITLPEMLKKGGYQTAFVGKWHLGDPDDVSTWAHGRGFDYAVQEQWSGKQGKMNFDGPMEYVNGMQDSIYFDWTQWQCMDEYRTSVAIDYLDKQYNPEKPLFLFMSYRAPHGHEKVIGNKTLYADRDWPEDERRHAAKVTLLDQQIGKLLKKLDEMGELENTLVLFTSDNGPHHEIGHDHEFFDSNGELKGFKRDLYEGGVRVPFIAYWPGKIEQGSINDFIGSSQDFMPTFAEVAGVETPEQADGISLLPVFDRQTPDREFLNWEFFKGGRGFRQSVRIGHLKGVRYGLKSPFELYDLSSDIQEENNIADQNPEVVLRMEKLMLDRHEDTPGYPYGGIDFRN
ncbi:MAG: sulfatase-like hydrolase/transferase [Cyclobacteriaceae bacterium]